MTLSVIRIGVNQPNVINNLSQAWRQILKNKGVTEQQLTERVEDFTATADKSTFDSAKAALNLEKELASDNMTWNVFVKGLLILGIDDITLLV